MTKRLTDEELAAWEEDTRADDAADGEPNADDLYIIRAIEEIRMWREAAQNLKKAVDELKRRRKQYSFDPGDSFGVEAAASRLVQKMLP